MGNIKQLLRFFPFKAVGVEFIFWFGIREIIPIQLNEGDAAVMYYAEHLQVYAVH